MFIVIKGNSNNNIKFIFSVNITYSLKKNNYFLYLQMVLMVAQTSLTVR